MVFIAHRLATVQNCDRLLAIADGHVVQDGTYSTLAGQPPFPKARSRAVSQGVNGGTLGLFFDCHENPLRYVPRGTNAAPSRFDTLGPAISNQ